MTSPVHTAPPDQAQRERALDPKRSILVQAPAGSGKTDLLTRRFLRLLATVDDPAQIVAITFTKAAAAEMRHRILGELERAASRPSPSSGDEFSMEALAERALAHATSRHWNLLDLPGQLRISTIDSFCREVALRRPLLSTLGGGLDVSEDSDDLYRRAARQTLLRLGSTDAGRGIANVQAAIETLLLWRDNNWQEVEDQLVTMLRQRDRWMQEFWLRDFNQDDEANWHALRDRLERPFARAVAEQLANVSRLLLSVPGAIEEVLELARFGCRHSEDTLYRELAELAEFPIGPFPSAHELEDARQAYSCVADLLLTTTGEFRAKVDKRHGFPAEAKREKQRLQELIRALSEIEGLRSALGALCSLPPARYPDEDWRIVRACFTLLRHAAGELQVAFAEAGVVDFIEIAQIAQRILESEDGLPSDTALKIADDIHHLLVDEFQDTSRRQHKLIGTLAGAWPDTSNRTLFVVGDPMQSIYFFRDADAELFPRVQAVGLELPDGAPLSLDLIQLASNFRTRPRLVNRLNEAFEAVFGVNDGSNVQFSASTPARTLAPSAEHPFNLHLAFVPQPARGSASDADAESQKARAVEEREAAHALQTEQIVSLIKGRTDPIEQARSRGEKYRIAVLGRARTALAPIAQALRDASIPFRAVDLEQLSERPEILDALALAHAMINAQDRVSWLGVLRAPWCGLSLQDLHVLASGDDPRVLAAPIPDLLRERVSMLSADGQVAVNRLLKAVGDAAAMRAAAPSMTTGTWLQQLWLRLGGDSCVDAAARSNLALLWQLLDRLPGGDADLASPALASALQKLTAQPDPGVDGDCGVQLMTIHKSKGLEFEVVIVPELQAVSANTRSAMFSWLERGLQQADETGEITEFLIAPFQPKGGDRGKAREWVDREYRAKEGQETRRILYVAATRAREELHLFARPEYKVEDSHRVLCAPRASLLSTAWQALEQEVRAQFELWNSTAQGGEIMSLAASSVIPISAAAKPAVEKPALVRRLPIGFEQSPVAEVISRNPANVVDSGSAALYERHEGDALSRALGSAVHGALEQLARLRSTHEWDEARSSLGKHAKRLAAQLRAGGMSRERGLEIANEAVEIALRASADPMGAWILSPHSGGDAEVRWTAMLEGTLRSVQADRIFRASSNPISEGDEVWWIIDYKTAHAHQDPAQVLPRLRQLFAPQLGIYAQVLRKLHGPGIVIRAGLYYPRMLQFDWWEA